MLLQDTVARGRIDEAPQASFVFDHAERNHIQLARVQHQRALCTLTSSSLEPTHGTRKSSIEPSWNTLWPASQQEVHTRWKRNASDYWVRYHREELIEPSGTVRGASHALHQTSRG